MKAVSLGEASDVATALVRIRADAWDLVVLDLTLPGASGLDLLKTFGASGRRCRSWF